VFPAARWGGVKTLFALMAASPVVLAYLESVAMRNALGLMLASVVAAVAIAGIWFWTSSPRADAASPQTMAARTAEPLPATSARQKDDVEVTASLSKPVPTPVPAPQRSSGQSNEPRLGERIDVASVPAVGARLYRSLVGSLKLADRDPVVTAVKEAAANPQLSDRNMIQEVALGGEDRRVPMPGTEVKVRGSHPPDLRAVPELGADTDAVLASVGYARAEIESLRTSGVIR